MTFSNQYRETEEEGTVDFMVQTLKLLFILSFSTEKKLKQNDCLGFALLSKEINNQY